MTLNPLSAGLALIVSCATIASAQASPPSTKLPGQVVAMEAGEFFIRAPDTISAGLSTFVLSQVGDVLTNRAKAMAENLAPASATNDPTRAFHMVWVVRLDSGHTMNEWYDAQLRGERVPWAVNLGGPAFTDPPRSTNVTMVLTPGSYVLACYIGSAREDKNRYHVHKGMFKALTVRPSSAFPGSIPAGDVKAVISGTGQITLEGTLRKGNQSIHVVNGSVKEQEFSVIRVKPGRTATETLTWNRRMGTDHPFEAVGGFSDIPPGATLLTTVDLAPGTYLLWTTRSAGRSLTFTIAD